MPLARHNQAFSRSDWFFEIKHDGFRALALIDNGTCGLISRNGNPFSGFNVLCASLPSETACGNAILDGEIVCLDERGRSQFNELLLRKAEPYFYAFDLLWCDGKDLRFDGLQERKRILRNLISRDNHRLLYCYHLEERGEHLFRFVCDNDLEGMVAKPRNSAYLSSDSETCWLKIRNRDYTQTFGRDELFNRSDRQEPVEFDGWAGCALACIEAEL